ncbi:MAG: hypothetical protein ACJKTH_00215 [Patescibacteria group bacterium UBA2163]
MEKKPTPRPWVTWPPALIAGAAASAAEGTFDMIPEHPNPEAHLMDETLLGLGVFGIVLLAALLYEIKNADKRRIKG